MQYENACVQFIFPLRGLLFNDLDGSVNTYLSPKVYAHVDQQLSEEISY